MIADATVLLCYVGLFLIGLAIMGAIADRIDERAEARRRNRDPRDWRR